MYSDAALMVRILHQRTSSGLADLLVLFQQLMSIFWAPVHGYYTCFLHLLLSVRQASHAELLMLLQANSTTLPYLVDCDSTQSMVIVNAAGQYNACTAMTPPWPDFPE